MLTNAIFKGGPFKVLRLPCPRGRSFRALRLATPWPPPGRCKRPMRHCRLQQVDSPASRRTPLRDVWWIPITFGRVLRFA
jgi:hypothetical protein